MKLFRVALPVLLAAVTVITGSGAASAAGPNLRLCADSYCKNVSVRSGCVTLDQPAPTLSADNGSRRFDAFLFVGQGCEDAPVATVPAQGKEEFGRTLWVGSVYFDYAS